MGGDWGNSELAGWMLEDGRSRLQQRLRAPCGCYGTTLMVLGESEQGAGILDSGFATGMLIQLLQRWRVSFQVFRSGDESI